MKSTHLVTLELLLVFLLAGCANLPVDQDCRAGLENEFEVLDANGGQMRYHRSPDFLSHLSAAVDDEQVGDYQSCVNNIHLARVHRHQPYSTQNAFTGFSSEQLSNWDYSRDADRDVADHTRHDDR